MNKQGFTLAEVLVTMGIIGVVAAITMPTLTGSSNSKQLQAQFNTAHSLLSQAVYTVAGQKGPGLKVLYGTFANNTYANAGEITNLIYRQLKTDGRCSYNVSEIQNYNGTKSGDAVYIDRGTKAPNTRLANGMCVNVTVCANEINITIDTNGTKKPNKLGHDIFFFDIDSSDQLHPKASEAFTEQDYQNALRQDANADTPNLSGQLGNPCSATSQQAGNGLGCAYWALSNKNPDDNSKTYWDNLPK